MTRFGQSIVMLAALTGLATAASAQQPDSVAGAVGLKETAPAPAEGDIVVTARQKPTVEQVEKQAMKITRMQDFYTEPLARFTDPVCPGVVGVNTEVASWIIDRMRYDAERVGMSTEKRDGCKPNIVVAFVRDGAAAVKELIRKSGFIFAKMQTAEAKEIENETGPVRAWNNVVMKTRHGEVVNGDLNYGTIPQVSAPMGDSHIFTAIRLDVASSVILIDVKAIDGLTTDQIADYAAMRVYARTRPVKGDTAAGTILSLFDPDSTPPPEMTSFDIAYLRSLYRAEGNLPASAKIGGVSRQLRKVEEAQAIKTSAPKQR